MTSDCAIFPGGKAQNHHFAGRLKNRYLKVMIVRGAAKREPENFGVSKPFFKLFLNLLEGFVLALVPGVRAGFLGAGGFAMPEDGRKQQSGAQMFHGSFGVVRSEVSASFLNRR